MPERGSPRAGIFFYERVCRLAPLEEGGRDTLQRLVGLQPSGGDVLVGAVGHVDGLLRISRLATRVPDDGELQPGVGILRVETQQVVQTRFRLGVEAAVG